MPQMNKGGKFIFGKSLIRTDGTLRIPPQAMEEYHIADEGKVYLFTGSKITGGFCVTRKGLLHPSKLGHILDDTPPLLDYSAGSGEFIKYKGRSYCWVEISQEGQILLTKKMMDFLKVRPGMELLSIRSSDIAFTMGAKGPLLEKQKTMMVKFRFFKCNNFQFAVLVPSGVWEQARYPNLQFSAPKGQNLGQYCRCAAGIFGLYC